MVVTIMSVHLFYILLEGSSDRTFNENKDLFSLVFDFINSLTIKKQTTKFSSANVQIMLSPSYIILRIQRLEGKQYRSR